MEESEQAPDAATRRLGEEIRRARTGRYTVNELAKKAGVSVGLLSQVERGLGNPSFKTLSKIAGALDLRIGQLVESATTDRTAGVVRKEDRTQFRFGSEGLVYELLTPSLHGRLEMLQTTVPPGFSNESDPFRHEGEECVLLLTGELSVDIDGDRHTLGAGDAITYDSGRPHWWQNATDEPAQIVGAVTPPSF